MDSFYMKHELEDVFQRSSGLSGYSIRVKLSPKENPLKLIQCGHRVLGTGVSLCRSAPPGLCYLLT